MMYRYRPWHPSAHPSPIGPSASRRNSQIEFNTRILLRKRIWRSGTAPNQIEKGSAHHSSTHPIERKWRKEGQPNRTRRDRSLRSRAWVTAQPSNHSFFSRQHPLKAAVGSSLIWSTFVWDVVDRLSHAQQRPAHRTPLWEKLSPSCHNFHLFRPHHHHHHHHHHHR